MISMEEKAKSIKNPVLRFRLENEIFVETKMHPIQLALAMKTSLDNLKTELNLFVEQREDYQMEIVERRIGWNIRKYRFNRTCLSKFNKYKNYIRCLDELLADYTQELNSVPSR